MRLLKKNEVSEVHAEDNESGQGDPGEPPVCGEEEGARCKEKAETTCFCSKTGLRLAVKHIVSCCRKASGEINSRNDIVANIILNKSATGED